MKLDEATSDVSSQLDQQADLGVQITRVNDVPERGPSNKGLWFQIPAVTAVFADLKNSTGLSASDSPRTAAYAYTYFIRAMTVILERFDAKYIDIQGDGIFGLFSGSGSEFLAAAAAITMRTLVEREVAIRFDKDTSTEWGLTAGVGIDRGTLLVRRLGLRNTKENEVWAGKPVNMSAKLSSLADSNQVAVSERVFNRYEGFSELRRRVLLWSCGCDGDVIGSGFDEPNGTTTYLWHSQSTQDELGLDFESAHILCSAWCKKHGSEFCEALITGKRPQ